jgi:CubicO group peptidase (beta-lactamase class C family)
VLTPSRHLLTHASGLCYDAAHPDLIKIAQKKGKVPGTGDTIKERFTYPLIFEPGTNWIYGPGIDWAGKLVERVTGQTLEEHMKKNIFQPLGITSITFFPYANPSLKDKVPALTTRGPDGKLVLHTEPFINTGSKDCFGGHGGYGTMSDYLKVQRSLLANDGKLLHPSTVDMMFMPQLSPESKAGLATFRRSPYGAMAIGEQDPAIEADWGIGGILFLQDDRGRRKKGTLNWGGMANCFWTIDREADLALTFGTQVLPPGDPATSETITAVERGVYEMAGVKF